ncbi:UNVERIFIED_CONTAM: Transposon TX1 uncharacterized protein [Sesamum radiatum]|uniref:Transposon TX1 uncharacterized protein n=1 Tax=Sesamum radiatum TaxID=300843 RepID=A0AAW2I957_SESRA
MEKVHAPQVSEEIHHQPETDRVGDERPEHGRDKAIWNVRGLNRRDHQVAVRDLANEFRLHFIALLETRVLQNNVTRIQSGLLSRWRWFVDYAGPVGNEPWLVGGDFNAVLDMSEVSGASGDIRVAMNEFNDCILQTGLLPLPMQVSLFRFDNYLALSPGFLASVHSIWRHPIVGFVGGDRTDRAIDLRYLRPWARHILTEDEARAIIRPVTTEEVKIAFFDIEEDKAPGPDGFSSGFFKAAWPVVGEEVSSAIIDFFKTGRLLKQLNATLLTLIPKVRTPHSVAEFRPISCCNVIYKVITKILVSRIRESLDLLISPSQNAFVPGRLISDNVLLAQELFSGYNQCRLPPRCALKVDLRKAYDTVEWDFLIATLQLFGFPATFIRWIEECVTSTLLGCCEWWGAWILRGGKRSQTGRSHVPISICSCHGSGCAIGESFFPGLDLFASLSGLHTNPQKSQLIISKAASGLRDSLLATLGFQEGLLPLRYLGLPLISARLSITDCQPLLQKIDSRIKGWEGVQISFAGRVQLIKSVLISFEVYWAMAFILPKGIIKEMIKRLRTFLWKGTSDYGYPKVAWEAVCRPIDEGGLGIKDILALNRALMSKHLWAVIKQDRTSIWVDWIIQVRLRDCSIWTAKENKGAWGWRKMLSLRNSLMSHIHYRVGSGNPFHFGMIRGTRLDLSFLDSPGDHR